MNFDVIAYFHIELKTQLSIRDRNLKNKSNLVRFINGTTEVNQIK